MSKLLTEIFNKRPPQPKYLFILDVSTAVKFVSGMEDNKIAKNDSKIVISKVSNPYCPSFFRKSIRNFIFRCKIC